MNEMFMECLGQLNHNDSIEMRRLIQELGDLEEVLTKIPKASVDSHRPEQRTCNEIGEVIAKMLGIQNKHLIRCLGLDQLTDHQAQLIQLKIRRASHDPRYATDNHEALLDQYATAESRGD